MKKSSGYPGDFGLFDNFETGSKIYTTQKLKLLRLILFFCLFYFHRVYDSGNCIIRIKFV